MVYSLWKSEVYLLRWIYMVDHGRLFCFAFDFDAGLNNTILQQKYTKAPILRLFAKWKYIPGCVHTRGFKFPSTLWFDHLGSQIADRCIAMWSRRCLTRALWRWDASEVIFLWMSWCNWSYFYALKYAWLISYAETARNTLIFSLFK